MQLWNYEDPSIPFPFGEWYLRPPYAEGGGTHFGEQPTVSITEFYITPFDLFVWDDPALSRVSDLHPGKFINIQLEISDHEGELDPQGYYPGAGRFRLGQSRQDWQDALLLGPGGAIPEVEDTVVESITWGRIKASFDEEVP